MALLKTLPAPLLAAAALLACRAAAQPAPPSNLGSGPLAPAALYPAPGAADVCPDTPLRIDFGERVLLGSRGKIRIADAATHAEVETIDLAARAPTETVGGLAGYHYHPVIVAGRQAWIFPRGGRLAYGRTYAVTVDAGCFRAGSAASPAIDRGSMWVFTTRAAPPQSGASRLIVAADGSGDFCTVQGALDFIPPHNAAPVTVFIRRGTYRELVHLADKDNVTLLGEDRAQTVIEYTDSDRFNPVGRPYRRGVFLAERTHGLRMANLTIRNTTPQGGSQAEAIILNGGLDARAILSNLDLYSFQDTLQINGSAYVRGCYIAGDVDFMWGTGPCYFEGCDCVALRSGAYYTQIRNPASNHGYVYHRCTFDGVPGVMGNYLSRIQPFRFPHSEVVLLDCTLCDSVGTVAWLLQGGGPPAGVHFWEYGSREPDGAPADVLWRAPFSRQLTEPADAALVSEYSNPAFVLGGWDPRSVPMASPPAAAGASPAAAPAAPPPRILVGPAGGLALLGAPVFLSVAAADPGSLAYQWLKDGEPLPGAIHPWLRMAAAGWDDAGSYAVRVSGPGGSVTSPAARLIVLAPDTPAVPRLPRIPGAVFRATDYGVSPSSSDNAPAIRRAIAAASAAGGGTVELPAASSPYLSGPIQLQSRIQLQIDAGATLRMLPYGRYPLAGRVYPTFIAARGAHDVAITGAGGIDGQGEPWWRAFRGNKRMPHRPFMIRLDDCSRVYLGGLTLTRSPMFHAALNAERDLTVFGLTVSTDPDSPNTDGVDPSGTRQLIQNCVIADGDDNIAVKAGGAFCSEETVADCWFGAGHGMSVGGQSNRGLDGLLVKNCTFRGTISGLRLKADATQGGPVRNVRYLNLRMSGVEYPFVFYSYYKNVGSPAAKTTPAKVAAWNARPPNRLDSATLPSWRDIALENVTADDIGGASIIWGLPLASGLIEDVRLSNVRFAPGPGLEIYDAADVQYDRATDVSPVLAWNALALVRQPAAEAVPVGSEASFSVQVAGREGMDGRAPRIRWTREGVPLQDGRQPDGSAVSGAEAPVLRLSGLQLTDAGVYAAAVSADLDGFSTASRRLVPGSLPVALQSDGARLTVTAR